MMSRKRAVPMLVTLAFFMSMSLPVAAETKRQTQEAANTAIISTAFDGWKQGKGTVFDLLSDNAEWTVAGSSPVSGVYKTKQSFLDEAVRPIAAKLSTPIIPDVKHIVAQGNQVVVLWDGSATAKDGRRYDNSYAWHMMLEDGKITRVTAFLDTWKLNELMQ